MFNFHNKNVLITGGTKGIGLSTALAYAKLGANCLLTYNWETLNSDLLLDEFSKIGANLPVIFQANIANSKDTVILLEKLKTHVSSIDIFINNASVSSIINSLEDYSLNLLRKNIKYNAWPLVDYTKKIYEVFGKYPKYIIGISSVGVEEYVCGYDYAALGKSAMETLCRYMSWRLRDNDVCINMIRSYFVDTQSFRNLLGVEFFEFLNTKLKFISDDFYINVKDVSNAVVALSSGLFDSLKGQVITIDRGKGFYMNLMNLYGEYLKGSKKKVI